MKKKGLIIFVRKPEKGKVKTRLAASMGDEKALAIYKELLQHTHDISLTIAADRFVFYANEIEENDLWSNGHFIKKLQSDTDLGGKMRSAFSSLFAEGYHQCVIIGSDCLELTPAIIDEAFTCLENKEVVIGPAKDGGYYLLGMKQLHNFLFENKGWSTSTVFEDTVNDLNQQHISYGMLVMLSDIDTEHDWMESKKNPL